ncbi:MAG: DUF465 domain-containing protein [Deltaproteobacteria bacterium]|jgi:uncharacterized protein YdcH (DUF465 family)|nr:DUF465 domain-containing protein [Deltaproteobacteria bacterium]
MESADHKLIVHLMESDARLKRLYTEHQEIEGLLEEFNSRGFLTADEEMEQKRLKKKKLNGVDQMMAIVSESSAGIDVQTLEA